MEPMKTITINISDNDVGYDTELDPEEVVFWLDAVKFIVLNQVFAVREEAEQEEQPA